MPTVTLRYFAGAGTAAGRNEERVEADAGTTTGELIAAACDRHGADLARVAAACSVLVDGTPDSARQLIPGDGATVDLLPPFAGG